MTFVLLNYSLISIYYINIFYDLNTRSKNYIMLIMIFKMLNVIILSIISKIKLIKNNN